MSLKSVHFEIFGRVQGVYFRKYTRETAVKQGLVGWVQNTHRGTVVGVAQGAGPQVDTLKQWLREVGSPESHIDRCEFSRDRTIPRTLYDRFTIRK